MELLIVTMYALLLSLPISFFCCLAYMVVGIIVLKATGLGEERESLPGFVAINLSLLMGVLTFLVLFAYFARNL